MLLSLRYLIPDIPWHLMQSAQRHVERLRTWIQRLIKLALLAATSALQPLSTPQETGPGVMQILEFEAGSEKFNCRSGSGRPDHEICSQHVGSVSLSLTHLARNLRLCRLPRSKYTGVI
jgi:hypothetical protein